MNMTNVFFKVVVLVVTCSFRHSILAERPPSAGDRRSPKVHQIDWSYTIRVHRVLTTSLIGNHSIIY